MGIGYSISVKVGGNVIHSIDSVAVIIGIEKIHRTVGICIRDTLDFGEHTIVVVIPIQVVGLTVMVTITIAIDFIAHPI